MSNESIYNVLVSAYIDYIAKGVIQMPKVFKTEIDPRTIKCKIKNIFPKIRKSTYQNFEKGM